MVRGTSFQSVCFRSVCFRTVCALGLAIMPGLTSGCHGSAGGPFPHVDLMAVSPDRSDAAPAPLRLQLVRQDPNGKRLVVTGDFWTVSSPSISYDGNSLLFRGQRNAGDGPGIWQTDLKGRKPRLLTLGNGDPDHPITLADGRVLFSDIVALEPGTRSLFSANPDGSDQQRLTFGNHMDGSPRLLPEGHVLFQRWFLGRSDVSGAVAMTIRPDGTGVSRYHGRFLHDDLADKGPIPLGRRRIPALSRIVIEERGLRTRLRPRVDMTETTGTLLCLDVHESMLAHVRDLPRGTIREVRVTGIVRDGGAGGLEAPVLATATVHGDGSFLVEVPADRPLRLVLIDSEGRDVASLDSGIWVRPKERRGCVGCHEPPDTIPRNRKPEAVIVSAGLPPGAEVVDEP